MLEICVLYEFFTFLSIHLHLSLGFEVVAFSNLCGSHDLVNSPIFV